MCASKGSSGLKMPLMITIPINQWRTKHHTLRMLTWFVKIRAQKLKVKYQPKNSPHLSERQQHVRITLNEGLFLQFRCGNKSRE